MRIQLDEGAIMPSRAHKADAGLDLMAVECQAVPAHGSATFHTGVHVEIPEGCAGLLVSKSGLNVRHDITSTGLIDAQYTGEIVVKLDNSGETDYLVKRGDRISQLVIIPLWYDPIIEVVDKLPEVAGRGDRGFGSSGR
jgi:dUTP pyrophosphatase